MHYDKDVVGNGKKFIRPRRRGGADMKMSLSGKRCGRG
jgi:hypothetical protein